MQQINSRGVDALDKTKRRRLMKNVLMFVLPVILLYSPSFASDAQNQDTAVIDKFISKQETRESGYEYKDARKVNAGDLNRDGILDLAVLYTLEGAFGANN